MSAMKFFGPAIAALALLPANAFAAGDPTGVWMNDTGRGAVEIKQCGAKLCGTVAWVKSAKDADGCGKAIIGEVANVGGGVWDNGWVYDPERGRKFDVELKPLSNGTLQVTGYMGSKFFSKTMIWTRAPQDLKLCGQQEAKAETPKTDVAPAAAKAEPAPARVAGPARQAESSDSFEDEPATAKKPVAAKKPEQAAATEPKKANEAPATQAAPKTNDETAAAQPAQPQDDPAPAADDKNDQKDGLGDLGKALGGIKLGDLKLDKVLTKNGNNCKLDTPWLKVQFNCEH
jgi:uncharacterized protein (DUF2147 family)